MGRTPVVFIATPCFGGMLHQSYVQSLIGLTQYAAGRDFSLTLSLLGHDSLITRSRNTLLSRFLDTPEATHLLFIDADIAFEPEQVERLLRADKEVVAGMYPLKVQDWGAPTRHRLRGGEALATAPLLYVGQPCNGAELERDGDFVTATYAGTGFMMIARNTVLRMAAAHPETRYAAIHAYPPAEPGPARFALFETTIEPDGTYLSEDYNFCRRWRALGGKVWLDTAGRLTHIGLHDFAGDPACRFPQPELAPAGLA
ncbi:hypothetical protein [Roseomonas sp. BN140053]|uniref:hypothetical protein n=1 Tax=Roseomonas sp. BN140053 TaxID=3391898 RepID=UPI0039E80726